MIILKPASAGFLLPGESMSELGKVVLKRVGDVEVVCREMAVGQLRSMIASSLEGDLVDDFLFEHVRLQDLVQMTNLTREQIDGFTPSSLRVVVEACKEANPDFFSMAGRLAALRVTS